MSGPWPWIVYPLAVIGGVCVLSAAVLIVFAASDRGAVPQPGVAEPGPPPGHPDLDVTLRFDELAALDGIEAVTVYGAGLGILDGDEEDK